MSSLPPPPLGSAPLPPPNATTADPLELTLNRQQTWLQRYWALPVVLALGVAAIVAIVIADTSGDDNSATGSTSSSEVAATTIATSTAATSASTTVITVPATSVAPVPDTSPSTSAAPDTTVAVTTAPSAPPSSVALIEPVQFVGKLDGVVDVTGHTPSMMTITCNGSKPFVVTALDASGRTVDVLIDRVGRYDGTIAVLDASVTTLQIESSGNWTVDVADLASAPHVAGPNSRNGDSVYIRDNAAGAVRVTHSGTGAFSVKTGNGVVVAEGTGAFDATLPLAAGPLVMIVRADGDWSIA